MSDTSSRACGGEQLPTELWVDVLSFLPYADLGKALCACRSLFNISQDAWRAACYRRWPSWAPIAAEPDANWRKVYELLDLRQAEKTVVVDIESLKKRQKIVTAGHRTILTEWLCEVSFEWKLQTTIVYEAVKYLDCLQLVGLACLRAAMRDFEGQQMSEDLSNEKMLDPARFAWISDETYTKEQVVELTEIAANTLPSTLSDFPNSRMHLRSYWHLALASEIVTANDVYIYHLAAFLLHISLVDLQCSSYAPSQLAAGALSLALQVFNKPAWPRSMGAACCYSYCELEPICNRLATIQSTIKVSNLRRAWNRQYVVQEGPYVEKWKRVFMISTSSSSMLLDCLAGIPSYPSCDSNESAQTEEDDAISLLVAGMDVAPPPAVVEVDAY